MSGFNHDAVEAAVRLLLVAVGEDADREGLRATPSRSARAWAEVLAGYGKSPAEVLACSTGEAGFSELGGFDQMVVLTGYQFHSTCEHHLLPFGGMADIGYLPGEAGMVVGLSKLGRLVDMYARRLQVQERLTQQVAEALLRQVGARGVGVRLRATHHCMACRGVGRPATMSTEVLLGDFQRHEVRAEFWHLCAPLPKGNT